MSTPDAPRSQGRPPPFLTERGERHASWLELFFDLVFVAAVAALARQLHADHSVGSLFVFAGLFVPVWWGWMGFTWYFTTFGTETPVVRVGVLSAMAAIAAVSAGVEGATDDASDTFVVAYAALLSVLTALYARAWLLAPAARSLAARFTIGNALGAVLWLSSLALDERVRPFLWAAAMVLVIATFMFAGWPTVAPALQPYDRGHIAERYGLFTIVVLGEAVVVTVSGLDTGSRPAAMIIALLGFTIAAAIWWLYFDLFRSMPVDHGFLGRFVWAHGHLFVFAGIAAAAVGVEFAVEAAAHDEALETAGRLPLGAGLAAYLAAMASIRLANRGADRIVALRAVTAAMLLALGAVSLGLAPLALVTIAAVLVVGEAAIELRPSAAS